MERLSCIALLMIAVNAMGGVSYRLQSTHASGRMISEGAKFRLEVDGGGVLISNDGGKTLMLLNTAQKTFMQVTAEDFPDVGGITVANPKTTTRDLGDGGTIEGYPTHHWIVETSFDGTFDGAGEKVPIHLTMTSESWRTDRLPEAAALFLATEAMRTGSPSIDKILDSMTSAKATGFPLKEVTTFRAKFGEGKEDTTSQTVEVHDVVTEVKTKPAQFAVPAGYKRAGEE